MKKLFTLSLLAAALTLGSVHAGTEAKSFKSTKEIIIVDDCRFRDMEFQIDTFYTGFFTDLPGMQKGNAFGTGSGGGFGLNFFFARYFGVGYEAAWYSNRGVAEHMPLGGNLFFRYPICAWNLAPYFMVGGGGAWDGYGKAYGNVGGGIEYRFTKNIGIFADSRFFYGDVGNVANLRSGLRFAF